MSADAGPVEIKLSISLPLDLDPAREDRNVTRAAGSLCQACEVIPHAACPGDLDDVAVGRWDAIVGRPNSYDAPRSGPGLSPIRRNGEKRSPTRMRGVSLLVKGSEQAKETRD